MPTETIEREREREDRDPQGASDPVEAIVEETIEIPDAVTQTASAPAEPRPSSHTPRTWLHNLWRALLIVGIALLALLLWQGTAHSQDSGGAVEEWVKKKMREKAAARKSSPENSGPEQEPGTQDPGQNTTSGPTTGTSTNPKPNSPPRPASRPAPKPANQQNPEARSPVGDLPQLGEAIGIDSKSYRQQPKISEIHDSELRWLDSLDLLIALEQEFLDYPPKADILTLKSQVMTHLIELSVIVGHSDNPRINLDELRKYLRDAMSLVAVDREGGSLEQLLPRRILATKRGSPIGIGVILLVFADRLNEYLDLEPIRASDRLAFRYRSGEHRYIICPTALEKIYTDEEFAQLCFSSQAPEAAIQTMTREQFWGLVLGEAGSALLELAKPLRADQLLNRALKLNPEQAVARHARAKILERALDYGAALDELTLAIRAEPLSVSSRLERSRLLTKLDRHEEASEDLQWLFRERQHVEAGVAWVRYLVFAERFAEAREELHQLESLATQAQKPVVSSLRLEVEAAPWVVRLERSANDRDRFEALDKLVRYDLPRVQEAMVEVLNDSNLRLANYAWLCLKKLTQLEVPRDAKLWRVALKRRQARLDYRTK